MILILTRKDDFHADRVITELEKRNERYLRFETPDFPVSAAVSIRYGGQTDVSLELNGKRVDLSDVKAVWNRRPQPPAISQDLSPEYQEFAGDESKHVLRGLWALLSDRFWVNPYEAARSAELKPYQLRLAGEIGFEVPRTLITNKPDEAMDFFHACGGEIIYKPFTSHFFRRDGKYFYIYANRVSEQDLTDKAGLIQHAPCIFQEYIPKKLELRVTVVGQKVFAAEIDSQTSQRSKEDWRRYDFQNVAYRPFQLPAALEEKLWELLCRLGLVFGCIDLILTPDGRFVFLEINQSGQWYWIETLTRMPILDSFIEMLLHGAADYRVCSATESRLNQAVS